MEPPQNQVWSTAIDTTAYRDSGGESRMIEAANYHLGSDLGQDERFCTVAKSET